MGQQLIGGKFQRLINQSMEEFISNPEREFPFLRIEDRIYNVK